MLVNRSIVPPRIYSSGKLCVLRILPFVHRSFLQFVIVPQRRGLYSEAFWYTKRDTKTKKQTNKLRGWGAPGTVASPPAWISHIRRAITWQVSQMFFFFTKSRKERVILCYRRQALTTKSLTILTPNSQTKTCKSIDMHVQLMIGGWTWILFNWFWILKRKKRTIQKWRLPYWNQKPKRATFISNSFNMRKKKNPLHSWNIYFKSS